MENEGQHFDRKSLRYALDKHEDMIGLACDCVGFANASGGIIQLGIEDDATDPPAGQVVTDELIETLRKRIPQITVHVSAVPQKKVGGNGAEYIEIRVAGNQQSIASTSDGRFFIRVSDETQPLRGDDLGRLMTERGSYVWELQTVRRAPVAKCDPAKLAAFAERVRASDRVSDFVKGKTDEELLEHYLCAREGLLTNLGVLWVGRREDRAALLYAPMIQCIKFDDRERKVRKWAWDEYDLSPLEMIEAVWREVPDWQESYELPAGLFRKTVPHYEEVVVRELLANALVHRPYSQRGDIFINLYPDRMEVHNPGLLPIGVTPQNILHTTSQRNPHLAKVFYDLRLMEKEGSGFDRMYETLLASGRPTPVVAEGNDRVTVTVQKQIIKAEVIDFMAKVDQELQPTQKELIALGMIVQQESVTALQLVRLLELKTADDLKHWIGHLREWGLVGARGRTKATEYFVDPKVLRKLEFKGTTTLRGIETHRLRELVLKDLQIYQTAGIGAIQKRIGPEISRGKIQRVLRQLVKDGLVIPRGSGRWMVYLYVSPNAESGTNDT